MKADYIQLVLTPSEIDLWDWAAWPTKDYFDTENEEERDDGLSFDEDVVRLMETKGSIREIYPHKKVVEDMIYRLSEQLDGMVRDELCGNSGKGSAYTKQHMDGMRTLKVIPKLVSKLNKILEEL